MHLIQIHKMHVLLNNSGGIKVMQIHIINVKLKLKCIYLRD